VNGPTEDQKVRYEAALHAMQSGVKAVGTLECEPKHLRVGINSALCELGAIASLLIDQGVIEENTYWERVISMIEEEVGRYEERLNAGWEPGMPRLRLA
jgi:hypothetical protein